MKTYHCTHCQSLVFFENVRSLSCCSSLAFVPERLELVALEPASDRQWRVRGEESPALYKLCTNYPTHNVCNWALNDEDDEELCQCCRYTRVIPNLSQAANKIAWAKLETAKRRLFYSLLSLKLPLRTKRAPSDSGLAFEFLQDVQSGGDRQRVLTGHDNGLITINIAEADDVYREQQRVMQHEPLRTLLGHFRHEIGHYYWDRLIASSPALERFRAVFGDERAEYGAALDKHYKPGPPEDWNGSFISSYASCHPWEDWAETWAHYLHMADSLESASAAGLTLKPIRPDEPQLKPFEAPVHPDPQSLRPMLRSWVSLSYVLNNLSRGLGLPDSYPFILTETISDKLQFIHDTVALNNPHSAMQTSAA